MTDRQYLVFSAPPPGVSTEEYDHWYHAHVRENIQTPGFLSAQRYGLDGVVADGEATFTHLAAYDYEGSIADLRQHLMGRIETGAIVLPPWFKQIRFGTWDCTPLEDRVHPSGR